MSQSLPIQVINSDLSRRVDRIVKMVGSQSLPIQVINSDDARILFGKVSVVRSQSLPIQVINSDQGGFMKIFERALVGHNPFQFRS